jgi:uncharacterized membrane protein
MRRRFIFLDAHRGLLMIVMAVDHASYFIARVHSRELWNTPLPLYPSAAWFWTRWVTHPCATGFFFLMGIGMTLLADGRRDAGWSENRITRFFVIRGLLLILLQLVVENAAWMIGDLSAHPGVGVIRGGPMPGGGSGGFIYLGVLFSLGASMIFWTFMCSARSWLIALVSVAAVLCAQIAIPGPDHTRSLYSPLIRILLIPGQTNMLVVLYPVVPWLGVTGLGLLSGRFLERDPGRLRQLSLWAGLGLLLLFVLIRIGGGFGNLNIVPAGWMGFLNVVKYPPSLAFLTVTLGVNLLLIAFWGSIEPHLHSPHNPLLLFGRTALFFYIIHLWVYAILGLPFRAGCGLAAMYGLWLLGLAILYPLCYGYDQFKRHKPADSVWRFF